jgi:peptidyl-prolyl cis-trans isomerase D
MLQTIRERAQGWIAWAIVILISIPFALWGIQSYLGTGSEPVVAEVNGVEITERELDFRYRESRARLREQLGAAFRPELFDEKTMRGQVLDQMIRENLLLQTAHDLGLRASDQELRTAIAGNPAFQADGRFDNATYERMLEVQRMSPPQYEESLRQRIVGSQISRAIVASALAIDDEVEESVRLENQQRRVSFIRLPAAGFLTEDPVPEEEIAAYYEDNRQRFQSPERIKVRYLVLDAEAMSTDQAPPEEELRERYESEQERFRKTERRDVRHILVALDADADTAAEEGAKARIEEIRERILAGEDFAALAKELSQDPGSAGQGGELGLIEPGLMDPAFDQAAFALGANELSGAVRSQFGYHLIEVTQIEAGSTKSFEEVKDQLLDEARRRGVEGVFYDWAERLANLTYESPDSLEPAAEALGLELQTSDWIGRDGGEGMLAHPKVVAAAFSDEVLKEGNNSELIEPERDQLQAVVVRVLEHEEAAAKPLDEVRGEIVASLRQKRAAEAAEAKASELAETLRAGTEPSVAAGEYPLTETGLIGRSSAEVPPGVRRLAFTLPRPREGAATFGSTALDGGDAAVVMLSDVVDGSLDALNEAERAQKREGLAQALGGAYYQDLLAYFESQATIVRKTSGESSGE